MKRSYLAATASAIGLAALMTAGTAAAQDDTGWYLRANAGVGLHHDADLVGDMTTDIPAPHDNGMQSELDLAYSLGIGYQLDNNWRVELDGDGLQTDLGQIGNIPNTLAKLRTNSLMLNAIYDFGEFGPVEPYVGAGVGIVRGEASLAASDFLIDGAIGANPVCLPNFDRNTINPVNLPEFDSAASCAIDDKDTAFGYQALAGIGINLTNNLVWDTHATYQQHGDFDFDGMATIVSGQVGAPAVGPVTTMQDIETEFQDSGVYSVMTGLRYHFGATPPPPPPPPPPMPVETTFTCFDGTIVTDRALCPPPPPPPPPVVENFTCEGSGQVVTDLALCPPRVDCPDGTIVYGSVEFCPRLDNTTTIAELCGQEFRQEIIYYEFNKGQSAETRNTINRILDIGQFCQVDNIRVVGHTDTSGAAAYNLNLSKRRAADAREELVRQGVNPAIISSEGKGETEPFVQTGDGVKEQLNRRTEVLIQLSDVGTAQLMR